MSFRILLSTFCLSLFPLGVWAGSSPDPESPPPNCACRAYPNEGDFVVAGEPMRLTHEGGDKTQCPDTVRTQVTFPKEGQFDLEMTCFGDYWRGSVAPARLAGHGEFTFVLTPLQESVPSLAALEGIAKDAVFSSNRFRLELTIPERIAALGKRPVRSTIGEGSGVGFAPACMCQTAKDRLEYIGHLISSYTDPELHRRARSEGVMGLSPVPAYLDLSLTLRELDLPVPPAAKSFSYLAIADARARRKGGIAPSNWASAAPGTGRNVGGYVDSVTCALNIANEERVGQSCLYDFELQEIIDHEKMHVRQCQSFNTASFYSNPGFGRLRFNNGVADWEDGRPSSAFSGVANLPAQLGDIEQEAYEVGRDRILSWMAENCRD